MFPALVAGVQSVEGQFVGVHRTYLHGADKAVVSSPRLSLGPISGGAVRLVEVSDDSLLVGEGVETAAGAVKLLGWRGGAWATLSTSGMKKVVVPGEVHYVLIAADRDAGGLRAAVALAERLEAGGRDVTVEVPPSGDFADWLGEGA